MKFTALTGFLCFTLLLSTGCAQKDATSDAERIAQTSTLNAASNEVINGQDSESTMERRVNALKAAGIDVEFHKYPNLGHGFGLGIGTSAEGWLDDAVAFWEEHMNEHELVCNRFIGCFRRR